MIRMTRWSVSIQSSLTPLYGTLLHPMTLRTQHPTPEHSSAVLTDEQRRRVADALENAQSENTRRNYASQFRKFRTWCEQENFSYLPAQPEVLAAYAAELADVGKSMSTIRLSIAAIVDAHR